MRLIPLDDGGTLHAVQDGNGYISREDRVKVALQVVIGVGYFALGVVQWLAEIDGLRAVLGWPIFVCGVLSTLTAWIPLVGTAAGVWGAHAAWGWDWAPALGLFIGTPVVFLIMIAILAAIDAAKRRMDGH
jgi:hypothetical protein